MATTVVASQRPPLPYAAVTVANVRVPIWPIVMVIYATLLPREIRVSVGGLYFFIDRIALILTFPWVLYKITQRSIRLVMPDWLMLFGGFWVILSTGANYGFDRAWQSGGAVAFDVIAGYFLARVSFRSINDIRRALILVAPGFFLSGLSLAIEAITHRLFVRPFAMSIFGPLTYAGDGTNVVLDVSALRSEPRLGLLRAFGAWPHPILAGLHLSTLLPVYWMSGLRGWPRALGIAAACASIFTVSSATFLTLGLGGALVFYDWMTRNSPDFTWRRLLMVIAVMLVVVEITTGGGIIGLIVRFGTLDPSTGYFRLLIWEYGSASVRAHPWFGIGFEGYERPEWMLTDSIDNHWLLWAIRYGLAAAAAVLAAAVAALFAIGRSASFAPSTDARFYRGIAISLSVLVLMMWTVALQGGTLTWFTLLLGGCVACAQRSLLSEPAAPRARPRG